MSIDALRFFLTSYMASGAALSFSSLVWQQGSKDDAETLPAFPGREVAYKASKIAMKASAFWAMLNILPDAASFFYSKLSSHRHTLPNWAVRTLKVSNALCFGTTAILLIPSLYLWHWHNAAVETLRQTESAKSNQEEDDLDF